MYILYGVCAGCICQVVDTQLKSYLLKMKRIITVISIVATLTSSGVEGDNCTVTSYRLDVNSPGTSCHDIYEKNPSSHGKSHQNCLTISCLL